jgi:uncharacterized membrane protein YqjE
MLKWKFRKIAANKKKAIQTAVIVIITHMALVLVSLTEDKVSVLTIALLVVFLFWVLKQNFLYLMLLFLLKILSTRRAQQHFVPLKRE